MCPRNNSVPAGHRAYPAGNPGAGPNWRKATPYLTVVAEPPFIGAPAAKGGAPSSAGVATWRTIAMTRSTSPSASAPNPVRAPSASARKSCRDTSSPMSSSTVSQSQRSSEFLRSPCKAADASRRDSAVRIARQGRRTIRPPPGAPRPVPCLANSAAWPARRPEARRLRPTAECPPILRGPSRAPPDRYCSTSSVSIASRRDIVHPGL